ncbi:hypothetical protein IV203_012890 [Nitzschia inconspicua]|uniref:Uncharacterized protein n=1 Tax=Nitzschia inconspicua TaxID=303405 RepID=A0A9K3Q8B7_9STRA|nr:hypothetical protein IV203_012890 [Nitzschia inconspicua]
MTLRSNDNGPTNEEHDVGGDTIGELQQYMEDNDSFQDPIAKTTMMITLCFAYIPDFTTNVFPYKHRMFKNMKRVHKPSRSLLQKEIQRRELMFTGYKGRPIQKLLKILAGDQFKLPTVDMDYLQRIHLEYKAACENKIRKSESKHHTVETTTTTPATSIAAATPRNTTDDRLRLIEAFLSDQAKTKRLAMQACFSRRHDSNLNNSAAMAEDDYFETVSTVFNDETWVPKLTSLPNLHPDLADARVLPLKQHRTNKAKVQEQYNIMTKHLHAMVVEWEQSGNGGQQRSDDAPDWGRFDSDLVVDGDDRKNFLPASTRNNNMSYLLYFWHKLDEEGCLQQTLVKLPDRIKTASDQTSLVGTLTTKRHKTSDRKPAASIDSLARTVNERVGLADCRTGQEEFHIESEKNRRTGQEESHIGLEDNRRRTGQEERRIGLEEDRRAGQEEHHARSIGLEERRIGLEELRLHNDMIKFQLELAEKILELEREMDGFDGPPNSLYEKLNKAKRKYEQLLDSSEGRMR